MIKLKRNMRVMLVIFTAMLSILIVYSAYSVTVYGSRWVLSPYNTRMKKNKDNLKPGSLLDRNGKKLAWTDDSGERKYMDNKTARFATAHVVGDESGVVPSGAQTSMAMYLYGYNNSILEKAYQAFFNKQAKGNNVTLTVDAGLSEYIYDQMGEHDGAAVVMNYKTGEILAMVSKPSFDPKRIEDYIESEGSELVNRASRGKYTPGSVFKIITAASALQNINGIEDKAYDCSGQLTYGDVKITDFEEARHGEINLKKAFTVSCNNTFAQIGAELGASRLNDSAERFGFNKDMVFDEIDMGKSSFTQAERDGDLAWSAAGQYKDVVSPLHMCLITSAIANNGDMLQPRLMLDVMNGRGYSTQANRAKKYSSCISAADAETIKGYMRSVVTDGSGGGASIKGAQVCGKTGTAEVSGKKPHAWFTGFIADEDMPYAVTIVLENTGSGGANAAPVAGKALRKVIGK